MNTKEKIITIAERKMRQGGYNGFSFKDIATELNIKPPAIHYHFPSKEDLAVATITNYSNYFYEMLQTEAAPLKTAEERLCFYIDSHLKSFQQAKNPCLYGALMGESHILPLKLSEQLKLFSERYKDWLTQEFSQTRSFTEKPEAWAYTLFSSMQGATLLSGVEQSKKPLKQVQTYWSTYLT